ncbi:HK97 gp10 family phage protein [Tissierella sp.]|uniref:HK97 gp10 family phage protein n=1 Tax=Tissierella sp. TaxID=41274 RepID=UPI0028550C6A|nr:HK97 gp10 family phage protein [Tissierella sp.]MDR7856305.1 HK97 gp10 family phage protein [Tissierella sp.]
MNTNERHNKAAIQQFRKELAAMLDDIVDIDIKVLNKAVNEGVADVKRNTPVDTGYMRKGWKSAPAVKSRTGGVTKTMVNIMDYASYVNYGHRIVSRKGETVGFVKGQYMLEKAINKVDKALEREFKEEVERVNRKHDK